MKSPINKIVIPAAGFGTRFLPWTKAVPKEMLPILDKPVIQYTVEEAVSAGIEDIILVTGQHKRAIEDHFDHPYELERRLEEWGKKNLIGVVNRIAEGANFIYIRQKGPYGNATPVKCSRHVIKDEPFMVVWGDEIVISKPSRCAQMIDAYKRFGTTILGGIRTSSPDDTKRYGYVRGTQINKNIWKVDGLVEKPGPDKAPSDVAINAGYLLTPDIFPILDTQKPGTGGEYYLPEAINTLAKKNDVYALVIDDCHYYDSSNKLAYIKTLIDIALLDKDIGKELQFFLKEKNL